MKEKKRFIKFIGVGILNTFIGYGFFNLFLFFNMNYFLANTISTIIAVFISFILNKNITFNDKKTNKKTIIKFVIVYLISYTIGNFNLYIFIELLSINKYLAGLINLFITTFISWLGHNKFSFK